MVRRNVLLEAAEAGVADLLYGRDEAEVARLALRKVGRPRKSRDGARETYRAARREGLSRQAALARLSVALSTAYRWWRESEGDWDQGLPGVHK